jgi:hypothetical protein
LPIHWVVLENQRDDAGLNNERDDPICVSFGQSVYDFPEDCVEAVEKFKLLAWRQHTVEAYLRGQEGVVGEWDHFCARPVPPLPTWWRYATNPVNGPTVRDIPTLDELLRYHGRRDDQPPGPDQSDTISMNCKTSFSDEREFEVFLKGGVIREYFYLQDKVAISYNNR